jgi:hypothetical protein
VQRKEHVHHIVANWLVRGMNDAGGFTGLNILAQIEPGLRQFGLLP